MNSGVWTVLDIIHWTTKYLSSKGIKEPRLDAELLLATSLGWSRIDLYLNFDKPLCRDELSRFRTAVKRRASREPLAYILGVKEFWSLHFKVTRDVLIPRPETETLVEVALRLFKDKNHGSESLHILDMGTGCGILAICLAKELSRKTVIFATDISEKALEVSKENARIHGVEDHIHFLQGDLLGPVAKKRGYFHLVLSNPPYIPTSQLVQLEPEIKEFEPQRALEGGSKGLDYICRIIEASPTCLVPKGYLLLEIGTQQTEDVLALIRDNKMYVSYQVFPDLSGQDRVVQACVAHE